VVRETCSLDPRTSKTDLLEFRKSAPSQSTAAQMKSPGQLAAHGRG
jgi:hypothetical protein